MKILHILHNKKILGGALGFIILSIVVWQLMPISEKEIKRNEVNVEVTTWYTLSVDGKTLLTFTDIEGDTAFVGVSTDTVKVNAKKQTVKGYWVNQLRRVPSCFGRIVVPSAPKPSLLVQADGKQLREVVMRQTGNIDNYVAQLQSKQNELHYYCRSHNVQDYGYNSIAAYSALVDQGIDSLQPALDKLFSVLPNDSNLTLTYHTSYKLVKSTEGAHIYNKECKPSTEYDDGFTVIQLPTHQTPKHVITHMSIAQGKTLLQSAIKPKPQVLPHDDVTLHDSTGIYIGEINKQKKPNGYGKHIGRDGSYYEGHWVDGVYDGFGFYVAPRQYLKVGEWKEGVFKGERLTYNADRIYGIDLSRHQHEKNGVTYPINWDKLRITGLGTITTKKVSGKVDYPISFAYIKSTEGTTVLNAYYAEDYKEARARNITTGTYHFFSTTSNGTAQAKHFLRCSKFSKGDLPPVLDIEPTDAQIQQMGGAEVMFKHVRLWLKEVEASTHVRPILYISQSFANQYMPLATDLGDNYFVWIARYGEYKPNFKLTIWQLSPDGKVQGIHPDVDINVFNGYKNSYQQFLERHCFK